MENGKGRASDRPASRASLPTPSSYDSESDTTRGQKRKRGGEQTREDESDEEEARFNRYFDPNQDPEERREVKRKSRALEREFHGRLRGAGLRGIWLILYRDTRWPASRERHRLTTNRTPGG